MAESFLAARPAEAVAAAAAVRTPVVLLLLLLVGTAVAEESLAVQLFLAAA